jgi:hypothetical protein
MARTVRALVGFTVAWLALEPGSVSADDRADVLALDALIAAAVVAGDTAFVAERTVDDFVMVHGDAWTRGRQPLLVDGKESLLSRVAARYYDVLDFDSVQAELHGDVALTFGRYLAHVARASDPARAWFSVRYERVYAKRGGRWQYLSHRTVHGPVFGAQRAAVVDDAAASLPAEGPLSVPAPAAGAAELLDLEREIGAAVVRGDAEYFARATAADFVMTHGDAWTRGGPPALVDDQASFLRRVASKSYAAHDYDVQAAELHGDVGITYGRYVGHIPSSPPDRRWFYVWYQKVYAKRDGRWVYLSHRTVDGAHYAAERAGLGDLHARAAPP